MAIKVFDRYGPRANPADSNYTNGSFKNESVPGANDGTPLEVAQANDMQGFTDALLIEAGTSASGDPDTAVVSQRMNALLSLFAQNQDRIVWVDTAFGGDLSAALDAATEGTILMLGPNTYNIVGHFVYDAQTFPITTTWKGNEVRNLKILGSRMPEYATDGSRFEDGSGTVIQGVFLNWADGFECYDVGIDCGDFVIDNLSAGGKYLEGFIPSTQKDFSDTAAEPEKYFKDIHFGNIKTLLKTPTGASDTFKHSILFEHCFRGSYDGYIECVNGYHGFVIKSQHIVGNTKPFVHGTVGTSYILKSDQWTECKHLALAGFKVGTEQDAQTAAALYEARDGINLSDITIGSITGVNCKELLAPAGTDRITDISIGSIQGGMMPGANGMFINDQFDRVKIGTHNFVDCVNGVITQTGCSQVDIGSGSVRIATTQGYDLAGDVTHGNISGYEMSNYVVKNSGYVPNPELITGDGTGLGDIDTLFTIGIVYEGVWGASGFYPLIVNAWGGKMTFRGFVNAAADDGAGTLFTLPFHPKRQEFYFVPMLVAGTWVNNFSVVFNTDGTVTLDPLAAGTVTDVALTGIEVRYNV